MKWYLPLSRLGEFATLLTQVRAFDMFLSTVMEVKTMKLNEPSQRKRQSRTESLPELKPMHPHAAGIDIGAQTHWVCIPAGHGSECVRSFGCFTAELHALANWLVDCGVETVAMESTGVYWIPVFQILEQRGLEVKLVNAHQVKTVPGRKSDV